jgi:5'-3' exonuclease
MLELFDSNNWARIEFEVDPTGLPLRRLFYKAFYSSTPSVFFFDGAGGKARRKSIHPTYKSGRNQAPDNFYIMLGFLKELLLHTPNVIVEVPGYEADDVIATFVKANPGTPITIYSTDKDFCALGVETPMARMKDGVPACDVRLCSGLPSPGG